MEQNTQDQNRLSCGEIIRQYRKRIGMKQAELAEQTGSSRKTIANWESNSSTPDLYTIRKLCDVLKIPNHIMLGRDKTFSPTSDETSLIENYRQIGGKNQKIIKDLIDSMLNAENAEYENQLKTQYLVLSKELTPSAAGIGCPDMELPAEPVFVRRNHISEQADTLITVSGDSMEPNYFDGDVLYVKFTHDCHNGDDVVCVYHEGFILKRLYDHRLYSLNAKRPFGDRHDDDDIRLIGKVIGVVDQNRDIPNAKDRKKLAAVFQDELKGYNRQ